MAFYPWVVIAHVVFVILSFGAHGVSAFAMFRVKRETDRARIGAVLDLSTTALVAAGIGLILAVVLGIIAAAMAGYFGRLWPWASIAVVVVVWIAMTPDGRQPDDRRAASARPAVAARQEGRGSAPAGHRCGARRRPGEAPAARRRRTRHRGHRGAGLADGGEAVLIHRVVAVLLAEGLATSIAACGAGRHRSTCEGVDPPLPRDPLELVLAPVVERQLEPARSSQRRARDGTPRRRPARAMDPRRDVDRQPANVARSISSTSPVWTPARSPSPSVAGMRRSTLSRSGRPAPSCRTARACRRRWS